MELVKHETCMEYFRRRLSEGWTCIERDRHSAVLLSPEGTVRREIDLRNDVETLRPSAAGDLTECTIGGDTPAATNWQSVDEVVPDDNTTYVTSQNDWQTDLYNIPASAGIGTITSVKIWARCYQGDDLAVHDAMKVVLKTDDAVHESAAKECAKQTWENHSETWTQNPETTNAWTWDEIDALQIGVSLKYEFRKYNAQCTQVYVEVTYTPLDPPTVTTQAATVVGDDFATGNGNIINTGGENCTRRGVVWDLATHGDPGNVTPAVSDYDNDVGSNGDYGTGAFTAALTGLPKGDIIYARAYALNSAGYDYGDEINFTTKPEPPTYVAATDGTHNDKVVVTWTKAAGIVTGYKVYEGANLLDTVGDVATYDDTAAAAPVITPGNASASDGTVKAHVVLSLAGESVANGASRTYKVLAYNATGNSDDSNTDTGYRGHGVITYQWQRSAADSDADYSNIDGGTTDPYNDVGAPENGDGRYFQCLVDATGAVQKTSADDRGYRLYIPPGGGNMILNILRVSGVL